MARTLEQIERELTKLRTEVAALKRQDTNPIDEIAGRFTGDEEWAAIMDEIEERRKQPYTKTEGGE